MKAALQFGVRALRSVVRRLKSAALRPLFRRAGRNFVFDPDGDYSFATISVGDDVFLGPECRISAPDTEVTIGNKVMFGPRVMLIAGDHAMRLEGRSMRDITDKAPGDDQPIVIEDDVWVGAGAIILKGVRIERGAVVAAGAVVTRAVPPYAVVAGIPARVIRWRGTVDQIVLHEKTLYPPAQQLRREYLETQLGRPPST